MEPKEVCNCNEAPAEFPAWKCRMMEEYRQVKERYSKLHKIIVKIEAGTCDFVPDCPLEVLKRQARAMGEYLFALEMRAEIEHIAL